MPKRARSGNGEVPKFPPDELYIPPVRALDLKTRVGGVTDILSPTACFPSLEPVLDRDDYDSTTLVKGLRTGLEP